MTVPADVQQGGQPLKYVNEALCSLLGKGQAELEGLEAVGLLASNEEGADKRAAYLAALSTGQETVLELVSCAAPVREAALGAWGREAWVETQRVQRSGPYSEQVQHRHSAQLPPLAKQLSWLHGWLGPLCVQPFGVRGGKSVWVEARLSPMTVAGRVTHVMGVCVDVTTRRVSVQLAQGPSSPGALCNAVPAQHVGLQPAVVVGRSSRALPCAAASASARSSNIDCQQPQATATLQCGYRGGMWVPMSKHCRRCACRHPERWCCRRKPGCSRSALGRCRT